MKATYDSCLISFIKKEIRQDNIGKWNERYLHEGVAEVTKAFWNNAKEAYKIISKLSLDPDITQILTGHGAFAAYLCKYKRKDIPACICDGTSEQTSMHVLIDCPVFSRQRFNFGNKTGHALNLQNLRYFLGKNSNTEEKKEFIELCTNIVKRCKIQNGSKLI